MAVRNRVQAKLNETACSDEQKPMLQLLSINLPKEYVDEFEELMELMVFMYGLRDGDKTQTLRHKAFQAMLQGAREYWAVELSEALQLRKAQEGLGDSPAASAQEDFPEEEEGDEFPVDEQAHP